MNLDSVIGQIKSLSDVFAGNVAGAAIYANAVSDQTWLARPAAYVVPGDQDAGANESQTGLWQIVTERMNIIVDLDNSVDRRGQAGITQLDTVRAAVFSAVLNWRPDWDPNNPDANREARGFRYVSGEVIFMDRARLHYQFTFELDRLITDADGWQLTGPPLTDIQSTVTQPASPTVPSGTSFDVILPQS